MPDSVADLPALLGGPPVRPSGPPPWPPPDPAVRAALAAAIDAGAWGQYHGGHVHALEAELAALHAVPHALTCASGTLAVEAALRALGVGPGDEVALAAYEYESNFLTVHALGAKPVLVEVAAHNWNLDPAALAAAISSRTKAVICSHLHGGIVPMREVTEIARSRNIGIVEDAAQAPGATVQGRPAGTWGDIGVLSFGGSKLLTAGRGGALLFRDALHFQRAKVWLHRGLQAWAPLSELQAAALRPQLAALREATARRLANVKELASLVAQVSRPVFDARTGATRDQAGTAVGDSGLVPFANAAADSAPAFYKVGFRFDAAAFGLSRAAFVKAVRAEGVAFDVGFSALHVGRSPSRFRAGGALPHATAAHHGCVVLHHPVLGGTTADVQQVADAVVKVYRHRAALRAATA